MTPFFSVVIPLYNKEQFIENTLKSVINQTFKDFEIIIINDGSTDGSLKKLKLFKDERITVYNQKNSGLSSARNEGIKKTQADYIAFLDADDLWKEDYLETMYIIINKHKQHHVFATNFQTLKPKRTAYLETKTFISSKIKIIDSYFNLNQNIISPSSMVINKSVFNNIGYFMENINYGEEHDFYIRCFNIYKLVYYKEAKIYYRINLPNQLTAPNKNFIRKIPNYDKYLKQIENPFLKKYLDFIHYELVLLYKMERNREKVKFYKKKIEISSLSFVQKTKYHLPIPIFYYLKSIYIWFLNTFIQRFTSSS